MNNKPAANFRRIVLDLRSGMDDEAKLRQIAELARLLDVGIHGLFGQDDELLSLAALPFAREIRLPTFEWRRLDVEQLTADLRHSAERARYRLEQIARSAGVPSSFETLQNACPISHCYCAGDIVVEREPARTEALENTSYALLMPSHLRWKTGPFVAFISPGQTAALEVACRLALAAHEGILLLSTHSGGLIDEAENHAAALGIPRSQIMRILTKSTKAQDIIAALLNVRQRFIVLVLSEWPDDAGEISLSLGVPVLLVRNSSVAGG